MVELIRIGQSFVRVNVGNDITIYDSYKVTSAKDMRSIIDYIYSKYLSERNHNRRKFDMVNEWRTHNLIYALGMFREHTKDVNFEYRQCLILKIIYCIFSAMYLR